MPKYCLHNISHGINSMRVDGNTFHENGIYKFSSNNHSFTKYIYSYSTLLSRRKIATFSSVFPIHFFPIHDMHKYVIQFISIHTHTQPSNDERNYYYPPTPNPWLAPQSPFFTPTPFMANILIYSITPEKPIIYT